MMVALRFRFHDRSPICIMAAEASRLMNASIIVGHILSGIGTCYILREAYRGFNTLCDDLRGTRRARIQNFSNVQPAVKQVDNDPKQYLSYVQAEVQHHNDLKQNLSYWRAAVRGLDIDPNRNFVHSQRADELARIEHIIRMRGESARSMTIGEIAEELKDFGYLWQILATAEEGDVRMK
ncbi:hypothetical protein RGQ29_021885 [Quercus rubra]|uniref:Uncharacterized protein n=1 Tax=Quercus rubra TaxID=3512 RepID=A0AAN7F1L8_QUERU|nr:hypothetical protein RGQ29_021885 [Quercus rubra]